MDTPSPSLSPEQAATLSEVERLEAMFMQITQAALQNLERELAAARASADEAAQRRLQIQIGMFRHAQGIFKFSRRYAANARWNR